MNQKKMREVEKALGWTPVDKDKYKEFSDYWEFKSYCTHNRFVTDLTREEFLIELKSRDGQAEKFQKFITLLNTKGYNLGMARDEAGLSFDEVSLAIDGATVKSAYIGNEYKHEAH